MTAGQLYVADSEANIIRAVDLKPDGEVRTLAGGDLFDFGDVDGKGDDVRLQHPLGLALWNGNVLIADTYNHKIKILDPQTRTVRTFVGTGKPGQAGGTSPSFYEPGGLSVANGKLYVTDTNNHAVRIVDLKTKETTTLAIKGLQPPASSPAMEIADAEVAPNAEEIKVTSQKLRAGATGSLLIDVALPAGYHLNPSAPQRFRVAVEKGSQALTIDTKNGASTTRGLQLPLRIPIRTLDAGVAELRVSLTLYYCREDNTGTCRIKTLVWHAPIEVTTNTEGPQEIRLQGKIL